MRAEWEGTRHRKLVFSHPSCFIKENYLTPITLLSSFVKQANPESSWFIWWFMCARRHLACPKEAIRKWCGLCQCPGHWTHIAKSLGRKGSHLHCLSKRKTLHHRVPSLTPVLFSHPWSSNGTHITHCWAWSSEHVKWQHFPVVEGADSHPPTTWTTLSTLCTWPTQQPLRM